MASTPSYGFEGSVNIPANVCSHHEHIISTGCHCTIEDNNGVTCASTRRNTNTRRNNYVSGPPGCRGQDVSISCQCAARRKRHDKYGSDLCISWVNCTQITGYRAREICHGGNDN